MSKSKIPHNRSIGSEIIAVAAALIFSGALLYATVLEVKDEHAVTAWDRFWLSAMLFYLLFMSLRAAALVALSFADRFFTKEPPPPVAFPLVTVIVPCFNEEFVVENAIASTLKLDYPNLEILVVDDGSTDLTILNAKKMESDRRVRVIFQANQGKAAALNRGIQEAVGEYVMCVDADSMLAPDVIRNGIGYLERDPRIGAVAGCVQVGNGHNLLCAFQRLEYVIGLNFHKTAQSFLSSVTIVPGPVGLFRKETVIALGGYRSSTFAEDADLSLRLLMNDYRTVYCAKMVAVTEVPDEFDALLKQRYRWSRGILQAVKANSYWLRHPFKKFRNTLILLYMVIESLIIPSANFIFAFQFITRASVGSGVSILGPFFLQLTLLDLLLTTYSVIFEKSAGVLILLASVNRMTYGLSMEVLRFFSVFDELAALPMNWNKLTRKGM